MKTYFFYINMQRIYVYQEPVLNPLCKIICSSRKSSETIPFSSLIMQYIQHQGLPILVHTVLKWGNGGGGWSMRTSVS